MASVPNSGSALPPPPPVWDARPPEAQQRYAGFWLRTVAALIDGIILGVAAQIIAFFIVAPVPLQAEVIQSSQSNAEAMAVLLNYVQAVLPIQQIIASTVLAWAYFAFQESSPTQATLGKRALGLRVVTVDGGRLDLLKASLRAWPIFLPNAGWLLGFGVSALISVAAVVACLTVAFSSRKQGLHDMMAGALVIKTR